MQGLGAVLSERGGAELRVWAPFAERVRLEQEGAELRTLAPVGRGYHALHLPDWRGGERYRLQLNDGPWRPDPASRSQPDGVHAASAYVPLPALESWRGRPRSELVFYELEVGCFTPEGTLDAAIEHLGDLAELGVSAIELLPVAEVGGAPHARNWGYDGVLPFCVRQDFGGPEGMRRFVRACRGHGLAVFLDVVYNHLGPEGNYLPEFGPLFSSVYRTPWGEALNFDGPGSDGVREFFFEHARFCFEQLGVDGLRLDSVVNIFDRSEPSFLGELSTRVRALSRALGRPLTLVAEADDNAHRWLNPPEQGGAGCDAMWTDDLHHALHARLTGERIGYYADFGSTAALARSFVCGSWLEGQPSSFRGRRWGRSCADLDPTRLVVFAQNHDQVGNRADGARLNQLLEASAARIGLLLPLLSPSLPLLWMGQEWGEQAPFHFFTSFEDPGLRAAVDRGRRAELKAFGFTTKPPEASAPSTFEQSKLQRRNPDGDRWWRLHRDAIAWGRRLRPLGRPRLLGYREEPGWFAAEWPDGHVLWVELEAGVREPLPTGEVVFDTEPNQAEGRSARLRIFGRRTA